MKRLSMLLLTLACCGMWTWAQEPAAIPASVIQDQIDLAQAGDEVVVAPGVYHGAITLKDMVTVRGAGEGVTILDGQGAGEVVAFGKESALVGFTVRNGQVLVASKGNFIGLFECTLEQFARFGVFFDGGSGVVAHNIIRGDGRGVGIMCASANPLIINNIIEGHRIGFQWVHHLIPSVIGNLFRGNVTAVHGAGAAGIVLERNVFDNNQQVASFGEVPDSNEVRAVEPGEFVLPRGGAIDAYRNLMVQTYGEAVSDHPIIIYDLHAEPGVFDAITLFPWASFVVSASTLDTKIEQYEAYDWVGDRALHAEYFQGGDSRPGVKVHNPEIAEKMRERYVLENVYVHPGSYYDEADGRRVFKRMTNLAQIEVVIPAGYRVVSCVPEGVLHEHSTRPYISIHDVGVTHIEVVMERLPAP